MIEARTPAHQRRVVSIAADDPCDVEAVGHLARLVLVTKELGWSVTRMWVRADLRELLDLAGLAELCDTVADGPGPDGVGA